MFFDEYLVAVKKVAVTLGAAEAATTGVCSPSLRASVHAREQLSLPPASPGKQPPSGPVASSACSRPPRLCAPAGKPLSDERIRDALKAAGITCVIYTCVAHRVRDNATQGFSGAAFKVLSLYGAAGCPSTPRHLSPRATSRQAGAIAK